MDEEIEKKRSDAWRRYNPRSSGDQSWMGQTGHFLVLLALVGAAWSAVCYWLSVREKDLTSSLEWRRMARWVF